MSDKITIPAGGESNRPALEIILPPGKDPTNYKIAQKNIPQSLINAKLTHKGKEIKWFNNFGVRLKGKFRTSDGVDEDDPFIEKVPGQAFSYTVTVPANAAPAGYNSVVWYDGENVQVGASSPSGGKYSFQVNIGDPPTGWGG